MTCTESLRSCVGRDSCYSEVCSASKGCHRFSGTPSLFLCDEGLTVLLVMIGALGGIIEVKVLEHDPFLVDLFRTLGFVEQSSSVFVHSSVFNIKSIVI